MIDSDTNKSILEGITKVTLGKKPIGQILMAVEKLSMKPDHITFENYPTLNDFELKDTIWGIDSTPTTIEFVQGKGSLFRNRTKANVIFQ